MKQQNQQTNWKLEFESLQKETDQLKQENIRLRQSSELFYSVMEATPDAIVIYDPKGKVTYSNPAFTRIFGWTLEDLLSRQIDFIPEENLPETMDAIKRMKQGEKVELETRRYTNTGAVLDVQLSSSTYYDTTGNPSGSVVILRNITEKKEAARRENEKRFQLVTETLPAAILVSRQSDGIIVYANEHAGVFFGMSLDRIVHRHIGNMFDEAVLDALDERGVIMDYEITGEKGDGTAFWASVSMQPIIYREEPCFLGVLFDLTERKLAEYEIHRLQEELNSRLREKEGKYLTFKLASGEFGIRLGKIKKIMEMRKITPVPNAPEFLKGFTTVGGRLVPVIDLTSKLDLVPDQFNGRTCIIVAEFKHLDAGTQTPPIDIGMIVNSVSEVLDVKGEDVADPPEFGSGFNTEFIYGLVKIGQDLKILLNIDKLFTADEYSAFERSH